MTEQTAAEKASEWIRREGVWCPTCRATVKPLELDADELAIDLLDVLGIDPDGPADPVAVEREACLHELDDVHTRLSLNGRTREAGVIREAMAAICGRTDG